ncbi:protein kinase [Nonomuraea sp. NPDC046802]|uniref:serine/threonine-protein kinase n=1 Tax=Nonomuraea sp. NPDC046802 TaxID=3154919 RepID=UPI003408BF54
MYGDGQWGVPGYTEVRELGSGAAGRVVLARRAHDGVEVAIKYLSDELRSDMGFVARFRHEARLLATLQSVYHARLIDYVESGQGAAIVMELIDGVSLREILRSEGPTGPEAALTVLKGSLQGLASAHALGVVHRDFKPENVMVQADGASKLVDFGIAVRAGEEASAAGTPPYMAPEQWSGTPASPATDVYAATVVFFECLTGSRPYRALNVAALARQHQSAAPPVDEVPAPLRGLVGRGLAKDPGLRPASAEAFLAELEAVAAEAYGEDWEERGRRRLVALTGLLAVLFPKALSEPTEVQTSLAQTRFGDPSGVLGKLPVKIVLGVSAVAVLVVGAVVAVNASADEPVLRAKTVQATPTTGVPATPEPAETETTAEPTPVETPEASLPSEPTPTVVGSVAPPPVQPANTARPTKTPRPVRTRAPKPTPTLVKKPVRTKKPAPSASSTPEPEFNGRINEGGDGTAAPTTAAPTTSEPTRPRPTTAEPTPTQETPTLSEEPKPTQESPRTPTPSEEPTRSPEPTRSEEPAPDESRLEGAGGARAALMAFGLMTSGTVPVTLAVKRRQRKKR